MPRPTPRRRSLVAGLFATLATTGCASGGRETGRPGGGPDRSGSTSPTPATPSTSPGMPAQLLLDWLVTGGYAGVRNRTLLYDDGTWTVAARDTPARDGRLPARDLARIRVLLDEARLGAQPERSIDPNLRDGFQYRIAHGGHVVLRDDTTLGPPLREVGDLLPSP